MGPPTVRVQRHQGRKTTRESRFPSSPSSPSKLSASAELFRAFPSSPSKQGDDQTAQGLGERRALPGKESSPSKQGEPPM
eukprot:15654160-Heterocapsa_arctica.AAC.1